MANYQGEDSMKVGFIGLGQMGAAMAANLVKAGHRLSVFNRTPGRAGALIELGAREATSVAAACGAEVVITMLADDDALSQVAFGEAGLIAHLPRGAIHLSMSSISVALSQRLTQAHAQAGQRYAAAPVFGRPAIEAMGEAVALVGKAGIDRQAYIELLTATVFNAAPCTTHGPLIAQGRFEPAAFAAPLAYKDVRLAQAAAESLKVPMPLGSLLHDRFLRLLVAGGEHLDWAAPGGLATQDAGGSPR
jgi:3-hydroxyisobutyrate dehydrogenase-like beta-hydroxyacid dehydrogenase